MSTPVTQLAPSRTITETHSPSAPLPSPQCTPRFASPPDGPAAAHADLHTLAPDLYRYAAGELNLLALAASLNLSLPDLITLLDSPTVASFLASLQRRLDEERRRRLDTRLEQCKLAALETLNNAAQYCECTDSAQRQALVAILRVNANTFTRAGRLPAARTSLASSAPNASASAPASPQCAEHPPARSREHASESPQPETNVLSQARTPATMSEPPLAGVQVRAPSPVTPSTPQAEAPDPLR